MFAVILGIQQVIGLVQAGLASAHAIADAVKAGKAAVTGLNGEALTAEDVITHVEAAILQAQQTGDAAASRLAGGG